MARFFPRKPKLDPEQEILLNRMVMGGSAALAGLADFSDGYQSTHRRTPWFRRRVAARAPGEVGFHGQSASVGEIEGMFAHLEQALVAIDFLNPDNPKKLMPRLNQLLNRAQLAEEEVHILRGVARAVQQTAAKAKR